MSKLATSVLLSQGYRKHPDHKPLNPAIGDVTSGWHRAPKPMEAEEYRMGVTIALSVFLSDCQKHLDKSGAVESIMKDARLQIIEAVFGEFRETINGIELAVWERDFEAARVAIYALREQMFSV